MPGTTGNGISVQVLAGSRIGDVNVLTYQFVYLDLRGRRDSFADQPIPEDVYRHAYIAAIVDHNYIRTAAPRPGQQDENATDDNSWKQGSQRGSFPGTTSTPTRCDMTFLTALTHRIDGRSRDTVQGAFDGPGFFPPLPPFFGPGVSPGIWGSGR